MPKSRANLLAETNEETPKRIKDFRRSWSWFTGLAIILSSITIGAFWLWHRSNAERQDRIFEQCRQNIVLSDSLLQSSHSALLDSLKENPKILFSDYEVLEQLSSASQAIVERQSALAVLEIEANKIQNQYEALGVWSAIITILFLIFSFYSLFKSEELRKEGVEAVSHLRTLREKAENEKENLDSFSSIANDKLESLEKSIDGQERRIADKSIELTKAFQSTKSAVEQLIEIGRLNTSTKIEDNNKKIQEFIKNEIEDYKKQQSDSIEEVKKSITALIEYCDELSTHFRELDEAGITENNEDVRSIESEEYLSEDPIERPTVPNETGGKTQNNQAT